MELGAGRFAQHLGQILAELMSLEQFSPRQRRFDPPGRHIETDKGLGYLTLITFIQLDGPPDATAPTGRLTVAMIEEGGANDERPRLETVRIAPPGGGMVVGSWVLGWHALCKG